MTLKIGVAAGVGGGGADFVMEAERLGVDSAWSVEAWGYDALTPLAFLAARTSAIRLGTAIVQLGSRSPALLGMSALTMQALSGGRFILGLGTSGPQVMEGWHGVRFERPLTRTRETVDIFRQVVAGERVAHQGELYHLPLPDGPGRSIRVGAPPAAVPVFIAALGPANLRLTGELADGWIGTSFMPESASVFLDPIRTGAQSAGRSLSDIELTAPAAVEFTEDVEEAAARHARGYAFTFGAMGSPSQNFYKDAFSRQGFEEEAAEVQRLWLTGNREAAAAAVPTEIGRRTNLLGTPAMVKERLALYQRAGITTLRVNPAGEGISGRLDTLGLLMDLVGEVNAGA
ncbi:MAG TPA: LLM class flavin-dependent oxidoreductase [Acidimicrobiales bacterium]|nr:LLM class flavin-dependent oxidoreductase [Acidimicrobiales bacterium]